MNFAKCIKKEYLLDQLSRFVSSRSGLIQNTGFYEKDQNIFSKCPVAISTFGKHSGIGADIDIATAMIKSMAEALERYTLLSAKENRPFLYQKTARELKAMGYNCFFPKYDVYEDFVYKNSNVIKQMNVELKTDWVAANRFSDNKMMWLPASLIYNNTANTLTNILKQPSSNGMSCSFLNSAVEDAILELIERDTFLYMWLAKDPGEEIVFDKIQNKLLKELFSVLDCKINQIKVIYKYTDTQVPCVFVLFNGKKKYDEPAFLITGSADVDIERACYRALLEFILAYIYNTYVCSMSENTSIKIVKTTRDVILFYSKYENFSKCNFLFQCKGKKNISDLAKTWNIKEKENVLKGVLKTKDVFIADITPRELQGSDVHVVRAYSPDLLDLDSSQLFSFNSVFKKKRINTVDKIFSKETSVLNSDPHCYP